MFYFFKKSSIYKLQHLDFLHRFATNIFIQEIFWALDKIIYFIHKK